MTFNEIIQRIFNVISNVLMYLYKIINQVEPKYFLMGLLLFSLTFLFLYFQERKKNKEIQARSKIINKLYLNFQSGKGPEQMAHSLLDIVQSLVEAKGYYFYLKDPRNEQYIIKSINHTKDAKYQPPILLPEHLQPTVTSLVKDGQVPLLVIPIKGGKGVFCVVPVKKIPVKNRKTLNYLEEVFETAIDILTDSEDLKNKVGTQISNTALDNEDILNTVINLSIKIMGASGGSLIIEEEGRLAVHYTSKMLKDEEAIFRIDSDAHILIDKLLGNEGFRAISKEDEIYEKLPSYFSAAGIKLLLLFKVASSQNRGIVLFWFYEMPEIEMHSLTGLQVMTKRMAELLDSQRKNKEIADSYEEMLKMMVRTIDNLEVYTVGHSELMARYTEIISREMNMDKQEIKDVVLAAALSNIGLLGFSRELLFKAGRYTTNEYEMVKLHSEVGASIVEATIGNNKVASYIRYHHERFDGNGYPKGLGGEEIPLGARIIAVVQIFLAKIGGRRYREPLTYEKAIQLLVSDSGTQLDPAVVNALVAWFNKKQANPAREGRSLGYCWEMRCSPAAICEQCPAYMKTDNNCWEIEGTKCEEHGNTCSSCFVYTEFLYRMGLKEDKLLKA